MKRIIFLFVLAVFYSCTYNELIPVCEPDKQMFLDLVQPIIENNCIDCHSNASNQAALLETYEGVIDGLNNYSLEDWVTSGAMPPYGMPSMSDSEINIIKNWANCE